MRKPVLLKEKIFVGDQITYWVAIICLTMLVAGCLPKAIPPPAQQAKVAVVMGAGAAKGFAHIGVLKILEAYKVPIHMIVGTSAGSFVGSLYAYGYTAYQLQGLAMSLEKDDVADLTFPDNGFLKGEKLQQYVNKAVRGVPIEKFRIPFHAVATNIQTGQEMVFGQGNAGMAVRASCSVPGVFQPPRFGNAVYVDGGVVAPVAVEAAKRIGADVVIAVDISGGMSPTAPQNTIDTILKAIDIMYNRIAASHLSRADIVIRPNVGYIGGADLSRRHEAILEGEKAALAAMPAIQQVLSKLRQEGRLP
jgi:NTE family protein